MSSKDTPAVAAFGTAIENARTIEAKRCDFPALRSRAEEFENKISKAATDEEAFALARQLEEIRTELTVRELQKERIEQQIQEAWQAAYRLHVAAGDEVAATTSAVCQRATDAGERVMRAIISPQIQLEESDSTIRGARVSGAVGTLRQVLRVNATMPEEFRLHSASPALIVAAFQRMTEALDSVADAEAEAQRMERAAASVEKIFANS